MMRKITQAILSLNKSTGITEEDFRAEIEWFPPGARECWSDTRVMIGAMLYGGMTGSALIIPGLC